MRKSYCSNCGAKLDDNSKFCSECGKHTDVNINNVINNFDIQKIVNSILKRPKLIILILGIIIVILGMNALFNSNGSDLGTSNGDVYSATVYGMNFNIPAKYKESYRSKFSNGESADFSDSGWTIEISVSTDTDFQPSKYVESSFSKTINGKQGKIYSYKSGHMSFVYFDNGYRVVIRDANFDELKKIII